MAENEAFRARNPWQAFVIYEWNPQPTGWSWRDVPFFILLAPRRSQPGRPHFGCVVGRRRAMEAAEDWPRLRRLLETDERSRLLLDVPLGPGCKP